MNVFIVHLNGLFALCCVPSRAEKARAAHEASHAKLAASSTEATRKRNEYLLAIVALNAELVEHSASDFPEMLAAAGASHSLHTLQNAHVPRTHYQRNGTDRRCTVRQ